MLKEDDIFVDKNGYQEIWNVVINPIIRNYQKRCAEIAVSHNAEEAI